MTHTSKYQLFLLHWDTIQNHYLMCLIRFKDPDKDDIEYFVGTGKYAKRVNIGNGNGFINIDLKKVICEIGRFYRKTNPKDYKYKAQSDDWVGRKVIIDCCLKIHGGEIKNVTHNEIKILQRSKTKKPLRKEVIHCPYQSPLIFQAIHKLVQEVNTARVICNGIQKKENLPLVSCMFLLAPVHHATCSDIFEHHKIKPLLNTFRSRKYNYEIEKLKKMRDGIIKLPSPCS